MFVTVYFLIIKVNLVDWNKNCALQITHSHLW